MENIIYDIEITPFILKLCTDISTIIGRFDLSIEIYEPLKLRKSNLARAIHATAAIEGNTLSLGEVTSIIEGQRVSGPKKDIQEIENLFMLYSLIDEFDPFSKDDFIKAHSILMDGILVKDKRGIRSKDVAIMGNNEIKFLPPTHTEVSDLLDTVFAYDFSIYPPLVSSSIFHHMIETVHPFIDGNGRIGRFWQSLYLYKLHSKTFSIIPIESVVKGTVSEYYMALNRTRDTKNFAYFTEYMLKSIFKCCQENMKALGKNSSNKFEQRVQSARDILGEKLFTRKEYMTVNSGISTASASNDLKRSVEENIVKKSGSKNQTKYKFIKTKE